MKNEEVLLIMIGIASASALVLAMVLGDLLLVIASVMTILFCMLASRASRVWSFKSKRIFIGTHDSKQNKESEKK